MKWSPDLTEADRQGLNFYNDFDEATCAWIEGLIAAGVIPDGVVDSRSITEIEPHELIGFTQCHFFAGVAGWPLALALAGIPATTKLFSGSPPCQPFSAAGKRKGTDDERHLWPAFLRLIAACQPPLVFGEQVASADVVGPASGKGKCAADGTPVEVWIDRVFSDLEAARYAGATADLPAAGIGAPHIRQRLWWGAYRLADSVGQQPHGTGSTRGGRGQLADGGRLGHTHHTRPQGHDRHGDNGDEPGRLGAEQAGPAGSAGGVDRGMADTDGRNTSAEREQHGGQQRQQPEDDGTGERLADAPGRGFGEFGDAARSGSGGHADGGSDSCRMGNPNGERTGRDSGSGAGAEAESGGQRNQDGLRIGDDSFASSAVGFPGQSELILCTDGKHRRIPVERIFRPLVDELSSRLGPDWHDLIAEIPVEKLTMFPLADPAAFKLPKRGSVRPALLKGAGNAICPPAGAAFVQVFVEAAGVQL